MQWAHGDDPPGPPRTRREGCLRAARRSRRAGRRTRARCRPLRAPPRTGPRIGSMRSADRGCSAPAAGHRSAAGPTCIRSTPGTAVPPRSAGRGVNRFRRAPPGVGRRLGCARAPAPSEKRFSPSSFPVPGTPARHAAARAGRARQRPRRHQPRGEAGEGIALGGDRPIHGFVFYHITPADPALLDAERSENRRKSHLRAGRDVPGHTTGSRARTAAERPCPRGQSTPWKESLECAPGMAG